MTWLHRDHLGSASVATDNTAAAASIPNSETCYKPYGERRVPGSGLPSKWTFAGGYDFVASTGLLEFGARQYDPYIGRFLSADTIVPRPGDPQSFNRYAYARNSPLSRIDPSGHADQSPDGGSSSHDDCLDWDINCGSYKDFVLVKGKRITYNKNSLKGKLIAGVDKAVWDNVPSTIGISLWSISANAIAPIVEVGGPGAEATVGDTLYANWRSGEVAVVRGYSASATVAAGDRKSVV